MNKEELSIDCDVRVLVKRQRSGATPRRPGHSGHPADQLLASGFAAVGVEPCCLVDTQSLTTQDDRNSGRKTSSTNEFSLRGEMQSIEYTKSM